MKKKTCSAKTGFAGKLLRLYFRVSSRRAEGFVDSAIKILIAVVLGALLLAGLYTLFGETVLFSSRSKHDRKCYA